MSETIILIMTSSSTRNTEPRGGRVAVMRYQSLPNPNGEVRKIRHRVQCLRGQSTPDRHLTVRRFQGSLIGPRVNAKPSW
jgi:hypothetical protein